MIVEDLVKKQRSRGSASAVCFADNPRQSSHVPVYIRLLDINDNAPTFATVYETYVCERTKPGQVGLLPSKDQTFSLSTQRLAEELCWFTINCKAAVCPDALTVAVHLLLWFL